MKTNHDSLPKDCQLLLVCARLFLTQDDHQQICQIVSSQIDWPLILKLAEQFGVSPLLYKHLSDLDLMHKIPDFAMKLLENAYRRHSISGLQIYGKLNRMAELFSTLQIPIILLKGIYFSKYIYHDIALRPMTDIDFLCKKEDCDRIVNSLSSIGFKQEGFYHTQFHESVALLKGSLPPFFDHHGFKVEVHVNIVDGNTYSKNLMQQVWDQALLLNEKENPMLFILSPAFQLIHLALHLNRHIVSLNESVALYWFSDIHEWCQNHMTDQDWDLFIRYVNEFALSKPIESILILLKTFWHTSIPETICDSNQDSFDDNVLLNHVFQRQKNYSQYYGKLIKSIFSLNTWQERLKYSMGLLFPSSHYLRIRYNINHIRFLWLYRLAHPIFVISRFIKRILYS